MDLFVLKTDQHSGASKKTPHPIRGIEARSFVGSKLKQIIVRALCR